MITMPSHPELRTARLCLRPITLTDAQDVFAYSVDPAVLRYTTGQTPTTVADTERFLLDVIDAPNTFFWAIRRADSGPVIGGIEFSALSVDSGTIHYALGYPHWGQGFTTEAVRAIGDWSFSALPSLRRIKTSVVPENAGSWRVLEKCGFERIGETVEHWEKEREPVTLWHYAIDRAAWLGSRAT